MGYFLTILLIIAADQITKQIVLNTIGLGAQPIAVIDRFFYLTCHRNSGAAFGMLENGRYFFIVLTLVMAVGMLIVLFGPRYREKGPFFRAALSLIIGGALGNFLDRLFVGSVVDFLDFILFGYHFPTFNVADSCIVIGAFLLSVSFLRAGGDTAAEGAAAAPDGVCEERAGAAGDPAKDTAPAAAERLGRAAPEDAPAEGGAGGADGSGGP